MVATSGDAMTDEAKVKVPSELRLNVAMFSVSLANTKLVLAARSVCGDALVNVADVNGLPGTG
jgi:hypothetical protein